MFSSRHRLPVRVALHQRHAHQQRDHQDERDRRGEVQVVGHVLPLNGVADEIELAVAELLRDVEGADRRDQDHRDPRDHPGQAQREDHPPQDVEAVASEVLGRLHQLHVHLRHHRVDRQDHVREVVVHHADHHRGLRPDDVHRPQADLRQQAVEDTRVLQDRHPRVRPDQKVHPHRDHDERDEDLLRPVRRA